MPNTCSNCSGGGWKDGDVCTDCMGTGALPLTDPVRRAIKNNRDQINDTLDKVNDIKEKVDEIKTIVEGL